MRYKGDNILTGWVMPRVSSCDYMGTVMHDVTVNDCQLETTRQILLVNSKAIWVSSFL